MPPVNLSSLPPSQRISSANPFEGQVLFAQVDPGPDGGTASDAGGPPVIADGGSASDGGAPVVSPPPPAPVRHSLAQITAASRERAAILSDSHLLGSQYAAYQANPSRYPALRSAIVQIQYYVEGRHPDLFSSRPAILAWLREANSSGDTVLSESVGNILAALGEMNSEINRPRAEAMAAQITSIQQMLQRPASVPEDSAPVRAAPPPAGESTGSTSSTPLVPVTGTTGTEGPSTSTLRRRADRAVERADSTCTATPRDRACLTARTAAMRATAAYRDAVCAETPRGVSCVTARASATSAREAREAARTAVSGVDPSETRPFAETPPPPPPPEPPR